MESREDVDGNCRKQPVRRLHSPSPKNQGKLGTVGTQPLRGREGKPVSEGAAGRDECLPADSGIGGKRAGGKDGLWDHRRSGWESGGQLQGGDKSAGQVLPGMTDVCDTGR